MPRYRSRSRSPVRGSKHYDDPRDHRRERRSPAPSGLLVRNISLSARPEDLRIPFERYGLIKDVYLPKNYYTGEARGFGFVKFRYPEDAAEAKSQLNHTLIGGREIRIVFAEENRKTPQEMRRVSRVSSRVNNRRRSPSWSPRRRYHSDSRSPSQARRESRGHGASDDYLITYHPADQDLFRNQFLPGMIEITSIMIDLPGIPDLSRVLLLHVMRKITGQVANRRVLQEMVGLIMHQLAHTRVPEGTPGVQPVLVEGPCYSVLGC